MSQAVVPSQPPDDPVGEVVADFVRELLGNAEVDLRYTPVDASSPSDPPSTFVGPVVVSASAVLVDGWTTTLSIGFGVRSAAHVAAVPDALLSLPDAALRAAGRFGPMRRVDGRLGPAVERALRDTVIVELLSHHQGWTDRECAPSELLAATLEYLIELSGTRVESHNLTHGVLITDALTNEPRLTVPYPSGLRDAKRSPLLFDGRRSVLVVDQDGRARTEVQAHHLDRLHPDALPLEAVEREFVDSGSLVALATRQLGGIGFFLREDRSIWAFVDGQPLVIRRSEHWTAFPLWLARSIGDTIGGGAAVDLIVGAALIVSVKSGGAIFAIVADAADVDDIVARKDRYDLRNEFDVAAMRPETRLHHLIEAADLDVQTLARLGELDGATVLDRDGRLLAYGAIISSSDSEHEGARTAAARSLSQAALVVLKVSEDGDVTVFRDGAPVATLLPSGNSR
ncbi:MAG: hypothetical protein HKN44_02420 [Ilumatobacter sp.]|nr:hypothetical protein [Ilumatobacter sp.]